MTTPFSRDSTLVTPQPPPLFLSLSGAVLLYILDLLLVHLLCLFISNAPGGLVFCNSTRPLASDIVVTAQVLSVLDKDAVNVFERDIRCFGVEKVDYRDERECQGHEDEVCLPPETIDEDRGDHDHKEVPCPLRRGVLDS